MANTILTPQTLWQDFSADLPLQESVIKQLRVPAGTTEWVAFSGRETGNGRVRVFATLSYPTEVRPRPALLLVCEEGKHPDPELIAQFVERGYVVLAPDYFGQDEAQELFTKYPENVNYANYLSAERHLSFADETAKQTCRYEWTAVMRYALAYLRTRKEVQAEKICVLAVGSGAAIGWQLGATENLCALLLTGYAGWDTYRNCLKYSEMQPEMDDERFRWIAGLEAQSYAPLLRCPLLFLGGTNDAEFSFDRARDTLARIPEGKIVYDDFTPNSERGIDVAGGKNVFRFMELCTKSAIVSPTEAELSCLAVEGDIQVKVKLPETGNKRMVSVWYSCGRTHPTLRTWRKAKLVEEGENELTFAADAYRVHGTFLAYARITENGFTCSSSVLEADLDHLGVELNVATRHVIYSEALPDFLTAASPDKLIGGFLLKETHGISLRTGGQNVRGVTSPTGLKYFTAEKRDMPLDGFLLLDVYTEQKTELRVRFFYHYRRENEKSYVCRVTVDRMTVWQKVQFPLKSFKTAEGVPMKESLTPDAIVFEGTEECLLNNVLWI